MQEHLDWEILLDFRSTQYRPVRHLTMAFCSQRLSVETINIIAERRWLERMFGREQGSIPQKRAPRAFGSCRDLDRYLSRKSLFFSSPIAIGVPIQCYSATQTYMSSTNNLPSSPLAARTEFNVPPWSDTRQSSCAQKGIQTS